MNKKLIIFFTILLIQNNIFAAKIGAYGTEIMPYIDMTNQFADTFVDFKYGFEINEGFATLKTNIPIKNEIMFASTKSVLELESDTLLDSLFDFVFKPASDILTLQDSKNYGDQLYSVNWSTDGNFIALGGSFPTSGNFLQIYSFNGTTLSVNPVDSKTYGSILFYSDLRSVSWNHNDSYLAIGGSIPTSGDELQIYSFNSGTGTLSALPVDSKNYGTSILSLDWSSDGNYLAIGGRIPTSGDELQIYSFNSGTGTLSALPVDSKNYGFSIHSVNWSPDGNYLAIGGDDPSSGNELQIYSFNSGTGTLSALPVDSKNYGTSILSLDWSSDGNYLAIGGDDPSSGNELQIYSFNSGTGTLSVLPVDSKNYGNTIYSVHYSPCDNYLAIGGLSPPSENELQIYSFNSETGALSTAPVESKNYGLRVWTTDWNQTYSNLATGESNPYSGDSLQIHSLDQTITTSEGHISGNKNSLILNGNLSIPNNKKIDFLSNTVIDGQNKTLELEDNAQLIIDSNVTLTLRNMTLQTGKNTDKKPIKLYLDGSLYLQNMTIILDDDFLFENGNLFINENVKIAGPHEFIYSSTHKCYINKNSKLKFMQDSTFTYSPKSADRNLITMQNKSSKLTFKNSTLATTYTGLRLTKGNLIFDGLVTVTHLNINTNIASETTTQTSNISFEDLIYTITYPNYAFCVDFSPNGNLLAIGGDYNDGIGTGQILKINNYDEVITITSIPFPTRLLVTAFSPNGNLLAIGGSKPPTTSNCGVIYKINNNGYLEYATEIPYAAAGHAVPQIRSITWSQNSEFIVVSGSWTAGDQGAYVYQVDQNGQIINSIVLPNSSGSGESSCFSPDGKFLAAGGWYTGWTYRFNFDGTITPIEAIDFPSNLTSAPFSMQYSQNQKYLAVVGWRNGGTDTIRIFSVSEEGKAALYWTIPTNITFATDVSWSDDDKNLVVASGTVLSGDNYSKIYTLDLPNKQILETKNILFGNGTGSTQSVAVSPDLRTYAFAGKWDHPITSTTNVATYIFSPTYDELITTSILYGNNNLHTRGLDNYVTFGNASIGNSENLYIDILSGSKVDVHGTLNIENIV